MVEEDFEKFLVSRRRFIKCSIGGIAAVLAMHSIPAVFPKALAQELPLSKGVESSSSPPKPRPVDDPSLIVPDSTPELNLENPNHPEYGKIPGPKRPPKDAPSPGEADFGTDILPVSGVLGVYAGQEVRPSLSLPAAPPDRTLYAPTLECPNKAPQESVTIYYRYSGMSSTARQWGVWDHTKSPPGWVVRKDLNSKFLNKYVQTYAEGDLYFTEVIKLSGYGRYCSTTSTLAHGRLKHNPRQAAPPRMDGIYGKATSAALVLRDFQTSIQLHLKSGETGAGI